MYKLYTDGASSPNYEKKPGGWAVVITLDNGALVGHFEGGLLNTTNQVMELTAMYQALLWIQNNVPVGEKVEIISDSKYALRGLEEHWYKMWEYNGMLTSTMEPPKNLELWKVAYAQYLYILKYYELRLTHTRGHRGNAFNELADKYAVKAKKQQGGS